MATKKAKTVGQLMAAVLKANPGETLAIVFDSDEGKYFVDFGDDGSYGPKLYGSLKRIGQRNLAKKDAAISKLRGRFGA